MLLYLSDIMMSTGKYHVFSLLYPFYGNYRTADRSEEIRMFVFGEAGKIICQILRNLSRVKLQNVPGDGLCDAL